MTARDVSTAQRLVAGRYRLREPLGRGGMGTVWLAEDELLQRPVAVKEVRPPAAGSDEEREVLRERTLREARAAARLDHPGAVRVFDVLDEGGKPFIVMELLSGRTLSECLRDGGPLPPARVAEMGLQLLEALHAAHRAGIVHRDVKPGNVVCRDDGRITLTDFGIASTEGDPSITSTGLLLGSPAYIAPERARGGPPEPPSDLWSLGATLFTAVEGRPPFDRKEPFATLTAVVTDDHEPFALAGPLAPVIDVLLSKDPARRPDYSELRRALQQAREEAEQHLTPAPAPMEEPETGGQTVAMAYPSEREIARAPHPAAGPVVGIGRGRRLAAYAVLALLVFVVAAAIGALVTRGGRDTSGRGDPSASASGSPTTGRWGAAQLVTYRSPEGWSIQHPKGWTVEPRTIRGEHLTQLSSPDGTRYIRVQKSATSGSPRADWESFAPQFAHMVSGYHQIGIRDTTLHGAPAAAWEFTYTAGGVSWHALDVEAALPAGTYALLYQARADQWSATVRERRAVLDSLKTG